LIDSVESEDPTISDMKVLAEGFRDLSRALPEPAAEPKAAEPSPAATNGEPVATAPKQPTTWTRPVAIRQDMPRWNAPDAISRRTEYNGIIRVRVDATGKVLSSEMVRPSHPIYDGQLMRAAHDWMYEPARQDGMAVPSEVLVEVRLRPQE
jgi:hypothetical protein